MSQFQTSEKPTVADFFNYVQRKKINFKLVTSFYPLDHEILHNEINRPGLSLVGFYTHFAHSRIQVFGQGEYAWLISLEEKKKKKELKTFFSYDMPMVVFSHGNRPSAIFLQIAEEKKVAVFISNLKTSDLIEKLYSFFEDILSLKETINGVMMEIFGLGVLITGAKGIGKSECALELIERGHRFIADEVVEVIRSHGTVLTAKSSSLISKHMSLHGIGIVNVAHLFGVRSILKETRLDFCIDLVYNHRLGVEKTMIDDKEMSDFKTNRTDQNEKINNSINILDCRVPKITLPVGISSNKPILIETAVMNHSLKLTGYDTAKEFNKKILKATFKKKNTGINE